MKTQRQERVKEAVRDTFIVNGETNTPERDEWAEMTWREAGQLFSMLAFAGLMIFGLHFLAYGRSEGTPPRELLVRAFVTGAVVMGIHTIRVWKVRVRFLAAYTSAFAVIGLFFRFVIHDVVSFSPSHLGAQLAILVLSWMGYDGYRSLKARRLESSKVR